MTRSLRRAITTNRSRALHKLASILRQADPTAYKPPSDTQMTGGSQRYSPSTIVSEQIAKLSAFCTRTGAPHLGQYFAQAGLRLSGESVECRIALGRSLLVGGPTGNVTHPVLGLIRRPVGDPELAIRSLKTALSASPSSTDADVSLGSAYLRTAAQQPARLEGARQSFERANEIDPANSDGWYRLGRSYAVSASLRGAFTQSEFDHHNSNMARTLESNPRHHSARYHLVRVAIRGQAWVAALQGAADQEPLDRSLWSLMDPRPSPEVLEEVTLLIQNRKSVMAFAQLDCLYVIHWRLLSLGETALAFEVKDLYAARIAQSRSASALVPSLIKQAQALHCLGRTSEALAVLEDNGRWWTDSYDRASFDKLASDLQLASGTLDQHQQLGSRPMTSGQDAFDKMVRGRSVAIVGPTKQNRVDENQLADHDLVIRTKSLSLDEAKADISYYADTSAHLLHNQIVDLLESGDLGLAVFRPSAIDTLPVQLLRRNDVRVMPSESSAALDASAFGVPRMVYDVLRSSPSSVSLYDVDFFTSGSYNPGYQAELAILEKEDLRENLIGYGHDLRSDFRFIRALRDAGAIGVTDEITQILTMTETPYLECVKGTFAHRNVQ